MASTLFSISSKLFKYGWNISINLKGITNIKSFCVLNCKILNISCLKRQYCIEKLLNFMWDRFSLALKNIFQNLCLNRSYYRTNYQNKIDNTQYILPLIEYSSDHYLIDNLNLISQASFKKFFHQKILCEKNVKSPNLFLFWTIITWIRKHVKYTFSSFILKIKTFRYPTDLLL